MLESNESDVLTAKVIDDLSREISQISADKGFWDSPALDTFMIPIKIALIHTELSEALEVHRKEYDDREGHVFTNMTKQQVKDFTEEMADAVIRLFDVSGYYGLHIGESIVAKIEKNRNRPYKHSKRY